VGVVVNGVRQNFAADSQPFISGGRTFLPVRGIAESLGADVTWNSATSTVYIDNPINVNLDVAALPPGATPVPVPTPTPLPTPTPTPIPQRRLLHQAAPFFDSFGSIHGLGSNSVWAGENATMGGIIYGYALVFWNNAWATVGGPVQGHISTLHNLQGQYQIITGYFGREDGSSMSDATISFFGDGAFLKDYFLSATSMPVSINVPVEGVTQLIIEVSFHPRHRFSSGDASWFNLIAYLE
jgi:hypothetical protein